jgi:hypothetical protein
MNSPQSTDPVSREHRWVEATPLVRWPHCGDCGIIKRKDGSNSAVCKGRPKIALRKAYSDPKGGPEFDAP